MDVKKYFEGISKKLDNLSDDDFLKLLYDSGLEEASYEIKFTVEVKGYSVNNPKRNYVMENYPKVIIGGSKVA
jgi:hypothetical protein